MTAIIVLGVTILVLLWRQDVQQKRLLEHISVRHAEAVLERQELLSRIQHPERLVHAQSEPMLVPDLEPDDFDLVGTITYKEPDPEGVPA